MTEQTLFGKRISSLMKPHASSRDEKAALPSPFSLEAQYARLPIEIRHSIFEDVSFAQRELLCSVAVSSAKTKEGDCLPYGLRVDEETRQRIGWNIFHAENTREETELSELQKDKTHPARALLHTLDTILSGEHRDTFVLYDPKGNSIRAENWEEQMRDRQDLPCLPSEYAHTIYALDVRICNDAEKNECTLETMIEAKKAGSYVAREFLAKCYADTFLDEHDLIDKGKLEVVERDTSPVESPTLLRIHPVYVGGNSDDEGAAALEAVLLDSIDSSWGGQSRLPHKKEWYSKKELIHQIYQTIRFLQKQGYAARANMLKERASKKVYAIFNVFFNEEERKQTIGKGRFEDEPYWIFAFDQIVTCLRVAQQYDSDLYARMREQCDEEKIYIKKVTSKLLASVDGTDVVTTLAQELEVLLNND